jgi:ubiquinol-cytochrome c reductase cytochrome b subunit
VTVRRTVRALDERTGTAPLLKKALRYVFPDHWSFLLGEVALYSFIVLVATGVYLTLFFEPSLSKTIYHGPYGPLRGVQMSEAYKSVLDISYNVKAGLLIRQTHHWAADVFVAAIVLHLLRIFFTGAFRKPRDLTYLIGLAMLGLALPEGYAGYSMVDDLLSGMGLAIGYSVALSIPVVGANVGQLIWGGPFPGAHSFESRLYIAHVFIFPILIGTLLALHLTLVASRHHTQFRPRRADGERKVIGIPAFPGQAPRSIGLMTGVSSVLFLLGGLIQINPIWLWGPYETGLSTNGAQPDWYLGWLIGAMRLVPGFDVTVGKYTVVPNPLWGGLIFPTLVFAVLFIWPFAERRLTRDRAFHNVLNRPRDAPWRTAFGAGFLTFVLVGFFAGSMDRAYVSYGFSYSTQVWVYRALLVAAPIVVTWITHRICLGLQRSDAIDDEREAAEEEAERAAAASA